ncbi:ABC transporter substrate-binding protein [Intrasporangium oryzae NRRL B-24470]|uniref:ABC transporter substrate-binding protein n=1 Tax=Intrasporangium oryzae NRRL B-24470 TaxID=1386089 RepID=W9GIB7_9MICO|nr:anti-sigma factor [Intrasporangium oryzae]EWT03624.1 ABC transporter substrate-binding protein [Intrasporangium oryzae NRRL B-24470]
MSHPDDEVLVDLALGSDEPEAGAREHLDHCDECLRAVAELRRAASLVATSDTALGPYAGWSAPPANVWSRVAATVSAGGGGDPRPAAPRPVMAGSGAAEAGGAHPGTAPQVVRLEDRRSRRRVWPWAAGMAAAGLVVGVLAGRTFWASPASTDSSTGSTVAQAELDTLDTKQRLGEATLLRTAGGVDLRIATSRPLDAGDGYLEVWLINSDGKRMVSIGVMGGGEMGSFPVSQAMLDQGYVIVDISKEHFDNRPEHSGDSLARGRLPA